MKAKFFSRYAFALVLGAFWLMPISAAPSLSASRRPISGLTIVGVHSPEFLVGKAIDKVKDATERLGIKFPVVQDNNLHIWKRFGVWAWPTIVLIDKK